MNKFDYAYMTRRIDARKDAAKTAMMESPDADAAQVYAAAIEQIEQERFAAHFPRCYSESRNEAIAARRREMPRLQVWLRN